MDEFRDIEFLTEKAVLALQFYINANTKKGSPWINLPQDIILSPDGTLKDCFVLHLYKYRLRLDRVTTTDGKKKQKKVISAVLIRNLPFHVSSGDYTYIDRTLKIEQDIVFRETKSGILPSTTRRKIAYLIDLETIDPTRKVAFDGRRVMVNLTTGAINLMYEKYIWWRGDY